MSPWGKKWLETVYIDPSGYIASSTTYEGYSWYLFQIWLMSGG